MAGASGDGAASANPERVQTAAELAVALNALRGRRTYAELGGAAQTLPGGRALPRSTVGGLVTKGRCERETLETFLAVCGVPRDQHERWLAAWERTRTATAPVPGAVRVRDASWRALGVHVPIEVPGADPDALPTYVPRDIDERPGTGLRSWLRAAAGRGGMVVLVGGSSTGKTRCLLAAVQDVLPDWWLLHPRDTAELHTLADQPPGRLVIWLDELQNYLGGADGLTAATADRLIQAGAVLVATVWPAYHDAHLTASAPVLQNITGDGISRADRYRFERTLLKLAHRIHLAERCSPGETDHARRLADTVNGGAGDPWLRAALRSTDAGLTQIIAAAPQLLDRWRNGTPYTRALLMAAADAARLGAWLGGRLGARFDGRFGARFGVCSPLPVEFLRAAAPGYCSRVERAQAPVNWFEEALDYVTQPLAGAAAALAPTGDGMTMGAITGYQLADYLDQHARTTRADQIPPDSFWTAAATHAHPTDLHPLGQAAHNRGLYRHAAQLWKNATQHGDHAAAADLVELLRQIHPTDSRPADLAAAHTALDDPRGVAHLLNDLHQMGLDEQVGAFAKRVVAHVPVDDPRGVADLLRVLRGVGAKEQITMLLARDPAAHVPIDDPYAVAILLGELREVGAREQIAVLLARDPAAHAPIHGPHAVARLLSGLGQVRADGHVEVEKQVFALAERGTAHADLDDPFGVAALLGELREVGAREQIAVLLARDPAAHAPIHGPLGLVSLLRGLREVGADEQVVALAGRAAAHVPLNDSRHIMNLLKGLRRLGMKQQVGTLAERVTKQICLDSPDQVAILLYQLREVGADEQVVALAEHAAAHIPLDNARDLEVLLCRLREAGADEQIAVLLGRDPAAHVALGDPHGVGFLLYQLRTLGADDQVLALAQRAAVHVPLNDSIGLWSLLEALRDAGMGGHFSILAERAAAHAPLNDPRGTAFLLQLLHEAGADEQLAVLLARVPAAHIPLDNLRDVTDLLNRLRKVKADEQLLKLAARIAAHIPLDNPCDVAELLHGLREVGADEQIAVLLARDPAAHSPLNHPSDAAWLLDGLRAVKADKQVVALTERLPAAGLFPQFIENVDRGQRFRFGRDTDGRATARWSWEDLQ
ncbi:hypothetical protein [Actinomadura fibrosa]|uniref:Uncharacterized protein n=1 Tax=Actinomadura fibrosa TaxID=111802 RepID=A0ABW2XIC8_9ACTN|nr:hypothetical protein [Actinomadura fibrosa]